VKEAYRLALNENAAGPIFNKLMHKAFYVAKYVRTETEIANEPVSISSVACDLAKKIFKSLSRKRVLLLGAGEMGVQTAKNFSKFDLEKLYISTRTEEKARDLARYIGGEAVSFELIGNLLSQIDILICQTGAEHYILNKNDVNSALKKSAVNSLFLIDISVPRNLDPEINELDNVYLYSIDDLLAISKENLRARASEVTKAEDIIDKEVIKFSNWIDSLNLAPVIKDLIGKFEEIKKIELENEFGGKNSEEKDKFERLANRMINKILHMPLSSLKTKIDAKNEYIYVLALKKLFHLDGEESEDKNWDKEE
jgi:glutamyl-tRNA reductase